MRTLEARSFLMSSSTRFSSASGMLLCCRRPSIRAMASSIFSTDVYSIFPFIDRTCSRSASRPLLTASNSDRTCFLLACRGSRNDVIGRAPGGGGQSQHEISEPMQDRRAAGICAPPKSERVHVHRGTMCRGRRQHRRAYAQMHWRQCMPAKGSGGAHQHGLELAAQLHESVFDGLLVRRGRAPGAPLLELLANFVLTLLVLGDLILELLYLRLDQRLIGLRQAPHWHPFLLGGRLLRLAIGDLVSSDIGHVCQCIRCESS